MKRVLPKSLFPVEICDDDGDRQLAWALAAPSAPTESGEEVGARVAKGGQGQPAEGALEPLGSPLSETQSATDSDCGDIEVPPGDCTAETMRAEQLEPQGESSLGQE
jgi:hypothetical protein